MKKIEIGLVVLFFLGQIIGCQPTENKTALADPSTPSQKIDSLFKSHYELDRFHGGVVITHKSKTIYENYFGLADRSWEIPIDEKVKFDIASLNKSMIAALALKGVEEGQLKLDDKLVDLLSDFSYDGNFHPEITLHQLLSHSSGLPDYDGIAEDIRENRFLKFKRLLFTNEEYVNFISKLDPINEPDKQFYYSNFAYHLVAIIIEKAYAKPFAEILKEKLTSPLGLEHTVSESKNEIVIPRLAEGYNYQEATGQWNRNPFIDLNLGRRIFSTAADLNRWAQVMDNSGYLSENSLALMQQNHLAHISKDISYGYGWVVFDEENKSKMGDLGISKPYLIHGGSTDGYKAMLININSGEYVISFLSNLGDRTDEMELAKKIVNLFD